MVWDVFISHASEDKDSFVQNFAEELRRYGLKVWYDSFTLKVGDSLRQSIDDGLAKSKYAIVVLSKSFFSKDWTRRELEGLLANESVKRSSILPVWHGVTRDEVAEYSPTLAGLIAADTSKGFHSVVKQILEVVKPEALRPLRSLEIDDEQWDGKFSQFYYINIPHLHTLFDLTADEERVLSLGHFDNLHALGPGLLRVMSITKRLTNERTPKAIPFELIAVANQKHIGILCSFNERFRTKGVPGPDELARGYSLSGNASKDPHIYRKYNGQKLLLPIDPKWITTSTAFGEFTPTGGAGNFAGLCRIKNVDDKSNTVYATPIVIGIPWVSWRESFLRALAGGV